MGISPITGSPNAGCRNGAYPRFRVRSLLLNNDFGVRVYVRAGGCDVFEGRGIVESVREEKHGGPAADTLARDGLHQLGRNGVGLRAGWIVLIGDSVVIRIEQPARRVIRG